MNIGCGLLALLLAFIVGAGAFFVAMPAGDLASGSAGPIVEVSAPPAPEGSLLP